LRPTAVGGKELAVATVHHAGLDKLEHLAGPPVLTFATPYF
jgi:hypothetical protein